MTALYIAIAGGLGSVSRFFFGLWMTRVFGDRLSVPVGTLTVNVLGSFLMGLLVAMVASRGLLDSRFRIVLSVGLLGGFTTYSSFALETVGLLEDRSLVSAFWYVGLTLLCAGLACFLGLSIGRRL